MNFDTTSFHIPLWAKTARAKGDDSYHPLICHLIDVAMVAGALWERVIPGTLKQRVTDGLGLSDPHHAGVWVSYLAGLHDIGKASPGFQRKAPEAWRRVRAAGYSQPIEPVDVGHGTVSAYSLLEEILTDGVTATLDRRSVSRYVAGAIGGHHGIFPGSHDIRNSRPEAVRGAADWSAARHDLARLLAIKTQVSDIPAPTSFNPAIATIIAGLVSVADWIGSDERYFPYAAPNGSKRDFDLNEYVAQSRQTALIALTKLGWLDWTPSAERLSLTELFDFITVPRPVQQAVTDLETIGDAPGIVIIEVPMGEGKTEAAFYLADQWCAALGQNGCYVAMPTMATSNQMFGRMRDFLIHRYPTATANLQLLHSQAALAVDVETRETDHELVVRPSQVDDGQPDPAVQTTQIREWFTRRKRGLLAPFGVGTVDQSLLAILRSPHHFVRLFGLAGKTIIFDEVHAYDIYMTTLFKRLMTWLGALGSSVVILSATLPDARRRELLEAYAGGAGIQSRVLEQSASYPRLSWVSTIGGTVQQVETSDDIKRTLHVDWIDAGDKWSSLVGWLDYQLESGGCVAIICNTVRNAQDVYRDLKPHFADDADDGGPELDLLHARFPFEERDQREKRALRRFGKPNGKVLDVDGSEVPVHRPRRAVLVATQVIEQSLDLDFDLIISEIAPIDLLLQRSGRLQRHNRAQRPVNHGRPTIYVIRPDVSDGTPKFHGGTPYVYAPHILFRTWLELHGRNTIVIPDDMGRLIEAVYDTSRNPPGTLTSTQLAHWSATLADLLRDLEADERQAIDREIPEPRSCKRIDELTRNHRAEDSPDIHPAHQALTRLGDPSVELICLFETPNGPALDSDGKEAIDTGAEPSTALARRLLRRSVSVSRLDVVKQLLDDEPPSSWRRSSLLRRHRLARFDADRRANVNGVWLRLDPELGLLVEGKEDA